MKKILLILFIGMFFISFTCASIEHTATTDTICNNGVCTKTLYSGVKNVYEDSTWKKVEDARSLKDKSFYISYLENDKDFPIEVIDYNYTSITIKFKQPQDSKELNKNIPIRIWRYNQEKEIQYYKDVASGLKEDVSLIDKYKETYDNILSTDESFKDSKDEFEKTYSFGMDSILEFGYESTTIKLQEADTENLEDTYFYNESIYYDAGAALNLRVRVGNTRIYESIIKFDISSIPKNANISDSNLVLYLYSNGLSAGQAYNISINHVYPFPLFNVSNSEWTEGDNTGFVDQCSGNEMCWAVKPNITSQMNFTVQDSRIISNSESVGFYSWKTKNLIKSDYLNGYSNTTIMTNSSVYSGSPTTNSLNFYSKEGATPSQRPYLNITYTTPADRWLWSFKRISDGFPAMMIRGDGHVNLTSIKANGDITAQQFCNATDCYTVTNFLSGEWISTATSDLNMDSYRLTNVGEIVMSGAIQGQNILPSQNMTYSLGNETNWFLEAYIGTINAINITANNLNSTIINSENITSENVDSTNIDSEEVNISNNLTIGGTKITVVGDTTYYKSVA